MEPPGGADASLALFAPLADAVFGEVVGTAR